jgi:DNA-binding CsgD family transcriptional regulator
MNATLRALSDHSSESQKQILLLRHLNGIKVSTRKQQNECSLFGLAHRPLMSLGDTMELPFNVFLHNLNHQVIQSNNTLWQQCGFNTKRELLGKSVADICKDKEQALKIYSNDNQVINNHSLSIFEEDVVQNNNKHINSVSFKMPLYDNEDQIMGIFGCSTILDNSSTTTISNQLTAISNFILTTPQPIIKMLPGREVSRSYFTKREVEMINLIIRGKTMREVGLALEITTRTAENYFANLKSKVNAISKSDFIDKVIDYFI